MSATPTAYFEVLGGQAPFQAKKVLRFNARGSNALVRRPAGGAWFGHRRPPKTCTRPQGTEVVAANHPLHDD